ncbi:hypothetical protein CYLTODRAFT_494379 [Cylindrobasidium torrendii FP15055 ss-10]|uniref:Uncharacterized protein n=1 Tax=Cylindrobasidium torrendii FP15055 ss-10 TaxID=1314674 RepID=A0A0D7AZZ5_9AGAR|nr:hypothetical protein CYLTODRAFT_494379 [Cylindrobasidium torrendii FP15055 ss-10]
MPPRRRATAYDASGLRVHKNGKRVVQDARNLNLQHKSTTTRNAHGEWIAQDAGGQLGARKTAKRRRSSSAGAQGEDEEVRQARNRDTEESSEGEEPAAKKRKFEHDDSFLEDTRLEAQIPGTSSRPGHPSSDLLKCIHHYASSYYTERNLLLNISREYREERRRQRREKAEQEGKEEDERDEEDLSEGESEIELPESEDWQEPKKRHVRTGKSEEWRKTRRRDMHRAMDGSALTAIGVLLQEYVGTLLETRIPQGWVNEMEDGSPDMLDTPQEHDETDL